MFRITLFIGIRIFFRFEYYSFYFNSREYFKVVLTQITLTTRLKH